MVELLGSIKYNTLEELNDTYKPNNKDILYVEKTYGKNVSFQRIMHRKGIEPRFELRWYKLS